MNIPQIPTGRNSYYDLGPTKQFDVETIREALRLYKTTWLRSLRPQNPTALSASRWAQKRYLRRPSSQDLADTYPCTQTERTLIKI